MRTNHGAALFPSLHDRKEGNTPDSNSFTSSTDRPYREMRRHPRGFVAEDHQPTLWERWVRQPQKIWLRRALFQVHLWSGIGIGLYILMMSVSGSVLVYSNELYRAATPEPIVSKGPGPLLTDGQLAEAAGRL